MDFFSGAILGGILYDITKSNMLITIDYLKLQTQDWLIDDNMANQIVERVNALSYKENEGKEQYCQRLAEDAELTLLLQKVQPQNVDNSIHQSITNTSGVNKVAGGNYLDQSTNTTYVHGQPNPKS